ncbi:globin domain-containing protein [Albimonas sp. CAU 1670]|uniref:globin domain-containing protein n=1 Tax=Albimonas sp. CAU 1670 TaxID=3032599 RepID=UPI0023DBD661|nr:globin domain-containing protein [Albimonas sp. CAU 1670]MDF2232919.1 globin domain-containing protein [Albimonas sp. CAU 1670]
MGLNDEQIAAIRATWPPVFASRDLAAGLFYGRLFQISPGSRALFTGDPTGQGRKLTETLAHVIDHLERIEDVRGPVVELARRHVDYGVRPEDYAAVGQALIWMLERLLGEGLSHQAREAWAAAYEALARIMIAGAYPGVDAAGLREASDLGLPAVSRASDTES